MGLLGDFFERQDSSSPGGLLGLLGGGNRDPESIGSMAMAAAMLKAAGPSPVPVSFGQALASGMLAGQDAYSSARERQMKMREYEEMANYRKAQTDALGQKLKSQQDLDELIKSRLTPQAGRMPAPDWDASVSALQQGGQAGSVGPTMQNADRMDAIRPPQLQGNNSAFPFSLNDVALMKLKGLDLTDIYKLATDPIKMEGGSLYKDRGTGAERYIPKLDNGMTLGPGGQVSVLSGYADSNADIKGREAYATEGAKASFDPFYAVGPDGGKYLAGSRAGVMGFRPGPQGQGGFGAQGGGSWPQPVKVEQSQSDTTYATDLAKDQAARYSAMGKAALQAPSQIAKLQRIGQLLDGFDGGAFSQAGMSLARAANSIGIKIDPKLGNKEAASAISNEFALGLRDPSSGGGMPGSMSNSDRQFLQQMSPGLAQSAEGRKKMIDTGVKLQRRNQDVYRMAAAYQRKHGRVDEGFYQQLEAWAERNPLFGGQ